MRRLLTALLAAWALALPALAGIVPTIGTAAGNKTIVAITVGTASGNKSVLNGWVGTAAGNKQFFANGLSATASPNASGTSGTLTTHSFPSVSTATASGGSGTYTYLWSKVSDDGNGSWTFPSGNTSSTLSANVSSVASGNSAQAVYQCTVTDTVTTATAVTNTVILTYMHT